MRAALIAVLWMSIAAVSALPFPSGSPTNAIATVGDVKDSQVNHALVRRTNDPQFALASAERWRTEYKNQVREIQRQQGLFLVATRAKAEAIRLRQSYALYQAAMNTADEKARAAMAASATAETQFNLMRNLYKHLTNKSDCQSLYR